MDPLGDGPGLRLGHRPFEQNRELVAPDPSERVRRAQDGREPTRQREQQVIADRVTEAVVDKLEAIEVDEENGAATVEVARPRRGTWSMRSMNSARLGRPVSPS